MAVRDLIRKARRDLHSNLQVAALYIATPTALPVPVGIRLHTHMANIGQPVGSDGSTFAERAEIKPRIVFLRDQIAAIRRGAIVSVEPGEAYRIETVQPNDDLTISAEVSRLTAAEAAALPIPASPLAGVPLLAPVFDYAIVSNTGHGVYSHGGAAQILLGNVPAHLVNNRATVDETQKPADIVTFYDGDLITGRVGDGLGGTVLLSFTPTDATASWVSIWFVGLSGTKIFHATFALPSGQGLAHRISHTFTAYNRLNWATAGVRVMIESDGPGTVGEIQFVLHRLHKGRPVV